MSYRENADQGLQERIVTLEEEVRSLRKSCELNGDQKTIVRIATGVIAGVLLLSTIFTLAGVSCNHSDNSAKVEAARLCPTAAAPAGAIQTTPH